MLKKFTSSIINIVFILTIILTAVPVHASGNMLEVCKLKDLEKYLTETAKEDLKKMIKNEDDDSNNLKIRVAFEKARTRYHDTIKCVFDASTISILGSASGTGSNLKKDDLPALSKQVLGDLNKPDKACLSDEKRKQIIENSDPSLLVPGLLSAYNLYYDFITYAINLLEEYPDIDPLENFALENSSKQTNQLKLIMKNESENAIIALNGAFIALKELRRNFIMHVHFQCMMKNLEIYRKLMGNLRKVITVLPSVIHDASTHK